MVHEIPPCVLAMLERYMARARFEPKLRPIFLFYHRFIKMSSDFGRVWVYGLWVLKAIYGV